MADTKQKSVNKKQGGGHHKDHGGGKKVKKTKAPKLGFEAPLTPKTAMHEAKSAAKIEYKPQRTALKGEIRSSKQRDRDIDTYTSQYNQRVTDLANTTDDRLAGIVANVDQRKAQALAQADTASLAQADADAASAGARGAVVDPRLAQERAMAASSRGSSMDVQATALQGMRANDRRFYLDKTATSLGEAAHQHQLEANRRFNLKKEKRGLKAERGAFINDYISKAREAERKYGLEKSAFGLQQDQLAADTQQNAAANQLAASRIESGNKNAKRQAKVSRKNNKNTAKTSRANNQLNNATSRINNQEDNAQSDKNSRRSAKNSGSSGKNGGATNSEIRTARKAFDAGQGKYDAYTAMATRTQGQKHLSTEDQKIADAYNALPPTLRSGLAAKATGTRVSPKFAKHFAQQYPGIKLPVQSGKRVTKGAGAAGAAIAGGGKKKHG